MSDQNHNDLWRAFPKTAQEFEARFATEEDCRVPRDNQGETRRQSG